VPFRLVLVVVVVCFLLRPDEAAAEAPPDADAFSRAVAAIHAVGPEGRGHGEAARAWQILAQTHADELTRLLAGMDGAGPLARNWLRAAVDSVAEKALARGKSLPQESLEQFVQQRDHSPHARRTAYEWLLHVDSGTGDRLLPTMLDDPSLELRRDAVERLLRFARQADDQSAMDAYEQALDAARDTDQIKECVEALSEHGVEVSLVWQLGYIVHWDVIGPFDNTGGVGFDKPFLPEQRTSQTAELAGKSGTTVAWRSIRTDSDDATVDLNEMIGKHSGAVAYAQTRFRVDEPMDAYVRWGTANATKLWVNGVLAAAHPIYHAGMFADQYESRVALNEGDNAILLKICQNEQTEAWAQRWLFQLRVTDALKGAIHSK